MSASATLSQADTDMLRSLQSCRDFIVSERFADGPEWVGALDRIISRTRGDTRQKRHANGQLKALVASTPAGGVIAARDHSHAVSLRNAAKSMQRRARIKRVTPGKPERTVTLLD